MKEGTMLKQRSMLLTALFLFFLLSSVHAQNAYQRIVVLGDPHLPFSTERYTDPAIQDRIVAAKIKVRDDINGWDDVSLVAVVGDLVAETGIIQEYETAQTYFAHLSKPLALVDGNHDFAYTDKRGPTGNFPRGDAASRRLKFQRFRDTFGMSALSYTKTLGNYFLVFLSAEMETSTYLLQYSPEQLQWLHDELQKHNNQPTLIFTHPPLKDTLSHYNKNANTPGFYAQPSEALHQLLADNPQVLLWVSGHTHTPATHPDFASKINWYDDRVLNLHNMDMDKETIYTNSIYLYDGQIVIKTFNHQSGQWADELERVLPVSIFYH
jgi:3',5'-cyclic-AMP phosphodiesterase